MVVSHENARVFICQQVIQYGAVALLHTLHPAFRPVAHVTSGMEESAYLFTPEREACHHGQREVMVAAVAVGGVVGARHGMSFLQVSEVGTYRQPIQNAIFHRDTHGQTAQAVVVEVVGILCVDAITVIGISGV